jgi:putative lipoic acid-binding regulatory protein
MTKLLASTFEIPCAFLYKAIEKIEDEDIKDEIFEAISSHSRERDERHKMIRKEKQEKNPRSRGNVL